MNDIETVRYHLARMTLEDVALTAETLGQLAFRLSCEGIAAHSHEEWTELVAREWALYTAEQDPQAMEVMYLDILDAVIAAHWRKKAVALPQRSGW